ncbi:MAG TPA: serine hydrolase domain-containing protein [Acidimicrobiales bacterium]|jgi:CubicO group peptidase (beta-lactamase class C family)|nr:serine hydrolase domain-containing protein [Acidimicrobiales bacterium]
MKVNPELAGMDGARLARIDEHLRTRYVEPGKIAGCQVAVSRHGQLAHVASIGMADLAGGTAVADDTIWRIFSMSKPITGVALMTLYERGCFQLNDPVARFIPSWTAQQVAERTPDGVLRLVAPERPVTVRDVLMHTSGLGYEALIDPAEPGDRPTLPGARNFTLEELCERLATVPLHFHPGRHWLYSVSTDVCARLVEVLAGTPFDAFLRDELFGPLGMEDTGFVVPDDKAARLAASYGRNRAKELREVEDRATSPYRARPRFLSGGGGLVSTTADYLRFAQMLANGGELDGVRILGRPTVALMTENHLPGGASLRELAVPGAYGEVGFDGMGFGLTMAVAKRPAETGVVGSPGEFMWGGAASTIFWVDPVEDLVVVFMTQLMPSGTFNFRGQLKAIVYGAIVD